MPWRVTLTIGRRGRPEVETRVFEQHEIVIGRTPSRTDLVLADSNVSRQHCRLRVLEDGGVRIEDFGSSNGTFVNGESIRDQSFAPGDELMLGDRIIRLAAPPSRMPDAIAQLVPHPRSASSVIQAIEVELRRLGDDLQLDYRLRGDLDQLDVPQEHLDPERLWERTCAELFVEGKGGAYTEWNVSPTGQTTRFDFEAYRQRVAMAQVDAPAQVRRDGDDLVLTVRGRFATLPSKLGLSVVVHDVEGNRAYWALRHPVAEPDFHHAGGFALTLEA